MVVNDFDRGYKSLLKVIILITVSYHPDTLISCFHSYNSGLFLFSLRWDNLNLNVKNTYIWLLTLIIFGLTNVVFFLQTSFKDRTVLDTYVVDLNSLYIFIYLISMFITYLLFLSSFLFPLLHYSLLLFIDFVTFDEKHTVTIRRVLPWTEVIVKG